MKEVRFKIPKLAIACVLVLAAAITAIIIIKNQPTEFPVSDLERITLEERTATTVNYLEEIDRKDESANEQSLDRYIAYALEYSYNENDKASLTATEIKDFLESVFDKQFNSDDLNNVGISPLLLDKNVHHDPVAQVYTLNPNTDKRIIADIPVTKYIATNTYTNKDKSVYTIVYDKYTAKSPYDVLPHLNGGTGVKDYLDGKGKIKSIKDAIDEESAKAITTPEKLTTIEYVLKDKKLLIKSIK
jgi:hypothetical protein